MSSIQLRQVVHTSIPWRYEVQQIEVLAQGELSAADVYIFLEGLQDDSTVGIPPSEMPWPKVGVSLLNPETSATDLSAALASLPYAGKVKVSRIPSVTIGDPTVASRHLVTFLSRGGDVPLIGVDEWTIMEENAPVDHDQDM